MGFLSAVICGIAGTSLLAQDAPTRRSPSFLVELSGEVQALSRRVSPGVVQVSVSGYGTLDQTSAGDVSLFGRQRGTGSGVIVDSEGYIVTNAHLIGGAVHIQVTLTSGETSNLEAGDTAESERLDASIVGIDTESDLAVLKIERRGLTALRFMNSDSLRQGDLVLTVGAPLGLRNSVSLGVVSAPARSLSEDNPMVYIQTDASINPGNSGGALVNMNGLLAGLNTFILSKSGGNEGLGFAIPANTVRDVYMQLRKNGQVTRGEIGLFAQNITPSMAQGLSLPVDQGVIVADVDADGPAGQAGLQHGDVVLSLDGQKISSVKQMQNRLFRRLPGDIVRLEMLRGDKKLTLSPVVRERSSKGNLLSRLVLPEKSIVARLGILCVEVDRDIAAIIPNLRHQYGLIVAAKSPGGQAQLLDLEQGDIVQAINTVPVSSVEGLKFSLEEMKPGDPVVLEIDRDGRLQYVAFELDR